MSISPNTLFIPNIALDTSSIEPVFNRLYPNIKADGTRLRMLSRLVIIFLHYPVDRIDAELSYTGFYPNGYDPALRAELNKLFKLIIERIISLTPGIKIEEYRRYLYIGYSLFHTGIYICDTRTQSIEPGKHMHIN